jgi:hypothetical protein
MRIARLMLLVLLLLASVPAHAQPLQGRVVGEVESIESVVANADLVVVKKLLEYIDTRQAHRPGRQEITIAVKEETLKQNIFTAEPHEKENLSLDVRYPASKWKQLSHRLLVAKTEGDGGQTRTIDLAPDGLEVLTSDLKVLRDPAAVIRAAKETCGACRLP